MQHIRIILGIISLLILLVFTIQNASVVTINFLFWKVSISRALMIFAVLAVGVFIGLILANYLRPRVRP